MKSKFGALKTICSKNGLSFKVLTKSDKKLGHFGQTVVTEMKPRSILCSKEQN
jgi:hypothetical protein